MSKVKGEIICYPNQVETVRTLLKRIPIYIIETRDCKQEEQEGMTEVVISLYKHQFKKVQKVLGKLTTKTNKVVN